MNLLNVYFSPRDLNRLSNYFGSIYVNRAGNVVITPDVARDFRMTYVPGNNRRLTTKYVLYKYSDGFRWRRMTANGYSYQMFRNTSTNDWPALPTIDAAINAFNVYSSKMF